MKPIDVFLNLTYVVYVVAPAIKNELWLRALLMINALGFASWGYLIGNGSVVFWNLVFAGISVFGIVRLLRERRLVELPPKLAAIHAQLFPSVTNRDFLLFWSLGETERMDGGHLTEEGETVDRLYLIVDGEAEVVAGEVEVAQLHNNQFVGEMAFVSGHPASATVKVSRATELHSWAFTDLQALKDIKPHLVAPLLGSVNRDLVAKLRA